MNRCRVGHRMYFEQCESRMCLSVEFAEHNIECCAAQQPESVATGDVDSDGDLDVLTASLMDGKIAWYDNMDGKGSFGSQQVISTEAFGARSVAIADMDGDGDLDGLSASAGDSKIAWYENTDGTGNFGPQQVISTQAREPRSVAAADLDGDGDLDVLAASWRDGKIAWYENTDGTGSFGPLRVISTQAREAQSVAAADVDADGDLDVLAASWRDNTTAWYENTDGKGSFGPQQVISMQARGPISVAAADVDGDGDLDVLSASTYSFYEDSKIAWYQNTDGKGRFGPQQVISTQALGALAAAAGDADGDGDLDVFSASAGDNKIAWYQNIDGTGRFGPQQVISTQARGARTVVPADVDGDGDLDVFSASLFDNRISWYENLSPLVGDSNRDGVFNSSDLILVFQAGEYEDGIAGNSTFEEGDWSGDGDFDSGDLVLAFQKGNYVSAARFAAAVDWLFVDANRKIARKEPRPVMPGVTDGVLGPGQTEFDF